MKVICWLAIVMCFVSSTTTDNSTTTDEVQQYCQESCLELCTPCHELVETCSEEENDCGLEQDPSFGGVCPPHAVCTPKNQHCKYGLGILSN